MFKKKGWEQQATPIYSCYKIKQTNGSQMSPQFGWVPIINYNALKIPKKGIKEAT